MEKEGGLSVVFKSEVIGECNLRIAYEQAAAAESMKVPVVRAVGVERERGSSACSPWPTWKSRPARLRVPP